MQLNVLNLELVGKDWIVGGNYSIADISTAPKLRALDSYGAREVFGWSDHTNLVDYVKRLEDWPTVQKGLVTLPHDLNEGRFACALFGTNVGGDLFCDHNGGRIGIASDEAWHD